MQSHASIFYRVSRFQDSLPAKIKTDVIYIMLVMTNHIVRADP